MVTESFEILLGDYSAALVKVVFNSPDL